MPWPHRYRPTTPQSHYGHRVRTDTTRGVPRTVGITVFITLAAGLLALYSSWNRPLWYDEMVYFVLGGFDSVSDVLTVVSETTTNINQGTTGSYMVSDFLMLSLFGAQSWALRLPSLIFGAYFLTAAAIFLRGRGVGWLGLWGLVLLLSGQQTLMYYAGEARAYMPLAAAVMGTLAYYFIPMSDRKSLGPRLLGWSAVLIGVLFHPYFALYWPVLLVFALFVQQQWKIVIRFANPVLVAVGTSIFFAVASLTWLRGSARREDLDPYFWLQDSLWRSIAAQLTQAIYVERLLVILVAALLGIGLLLSVRNASQVPEVVKEWWPPLGLLAVAFATALLLALVSIQQGFWVIPRQWIGSIGLSSVAAIWLFSLVIRRARFVRGMRVGAAMTGAFGFVVAFAAVGPSLDQANQLRDWYIDKGNAHLSDLATQSDLDAELERVAANQRPPLSEEEWIASGNANVLRGGAVWEQFADYYTTRDLDEFVLRD